MRAQSMFGRWGLGQKLAGVNLILVLVTVALLVGLIGIKVAQSDERRAKVELQTKNQIVTAFIAASDADLRQRTAFLAKSFTASLSGSFHWQTGAIDANGTSTPVLSLNGEALNLNFKLVDSFTAATGAVATIFVADGNDFVRISTSLLNDKGARAIGTRLAQNHPGYAVIKSGKSYVGLATLLGKRYMTQYDPIKDAQGKVIGASFVGLDFSDFLSRLKSAIRSLKVEETGYYYVLDAQAGESYGTLIVHPEKEGQSLLESQDAHGRFFIKEMLETKNGFINYPWQAARNGKIRTDEKLVVFTHYPAWNWIIAGGTYVDEYTSHTYQLIGFFILLGIGAVGALSAIWYALIRTMIVQPLGQLGSVAESLAQGDLTARLTSEREDEIGMLMRSMNKIGTGLTRVVGQVLQKSESVASASLQIAQGNQDLSSRTEQQASALEETSASMEELGSTVKQNAERARNANELAHHANTVVSEGGDAVNRIVATMNDINASSQKIADIIGVIDGIAFQTNILALNAAVEAARAGEHGKGFAVVASEVRSLAGRAAQASKEIKELISNSVSQVAQGCELVNGAGQTMQQAITGIERVTVIMTEISAASREQSEGVQHIGEAVTLMDQVTQQNAALVEEIAAAAESLKAQANDLVSTVSVFRLSSNRPLPTSDFTI